MYRQLRTTFSEAAELYDRMRPSYPRAVFEELAEFGRLGPGSRVLEIGCGTGQATLPLAQRGYRVTAVELGAELAAIARRKLASFPGVEVVVSAFEDWPAPWSEAERGDRFRSKPCGTWNRRRVEQRAPSLISFQRSAVSG